MRIRSFVLVCLSAMIMLLYGCAKMYVDVPLVWIPTNDFRAAGTATLTGLYAQHYKVVPFIDARTNRKEIAKNTEDSNPKFVTTRDDVADWCTNRFKAVFKQQGFDVVDDSGNVVIKGEIFNFYVNEDRVYRANVGIRITVEDVSGKTLWQGTITGEATRFGRSYEIEDYYKALSDAYLDAVNRLVEHQEFRTALQNRL